MSQTELDQLIDQLSVGDAKARRAAAKQLGDLKRPEAISELANVYMKDEDSNVRKAAGDSLRVFRKMEQDMKRGDDEEAPSSSNLLPGIRTLLIATLVLTLLGNGALVVSKLLPTPGVSTPVQTAPSARDDLVVSFRKRIDAARGDATLLRKLYSAIQGMGAEALNINKADCDKVKASEVDKVDLGSLDTVTYPDLKDVNDQINVAALKLISLRTNYVTFCTDPKQMDQVLTAGGGAAAFVAQVDDVANKDLVAADTGLKKAIDHPAPTVSPTFTPTTPPTLTPSITPSPAPATPTSAATAVPPTTGPTAPPTLPATITFNGLRFDAMTSYKYQLSVRIDGGYPNGKTFRGTMLINANRQTSPLLAEYDVKVSDVNTPAGLMKNLASSLYATGSSSYFIINNVLYATGNVLDSVRPAIRCQAVKVTDKVTLQDVVLPDLTGLTLTAVQPNESINGVSVQHYHAEQKTGDKKQYAQIVDVYVSVDNQIPIRVTNSVSLPVGATATPGGYASFTIATQYDLQAQNPDVKVSKPPDCTNANPK